MQDVSLYISIPSNRDWKPQFGTSLADLLIHLTSKVKEESTGKGNLAEGYNLAAFKYQSFRQSSNISKSRQRFVDEMIAGGFTHWLSLDDDMTFPFDVVDRLIANNKDVVSCNARQKTGRDDVILGSCQGLDGQPINSSGKTGIEELRTMGGAIFLAKIDAFRHIPKPHFQVMWSEKYNDYVSEDVHFAALLRANGVKLWCDNDTSQHIGHVGDFEYRFPFAEQQKLKVVA